MNPRILCVLLTFALLGGVVETSRGLDWKNEDFSYHATPDDTKVVAEFSFTNDSDATVTIDKVETSCGCSVAKLDKKVYDPGETGKLEVSIKLKGVVGTRALVAKVYADGSAEPSKILHMNVEVPQVVKVSRRMLFWYAGEPVASKEIVVKFDYEEPVAIKEVTSADPFFTAKFRVLVPGSEYAVTVTPKTTALRNQSVVPVTIVSDLPYERHRTQTVYARIVPRLASTLPVRLEPGVVVWKVGDQASSKTIRMVVTDDQPLSLQPMFESEKTAAFTTQLKTVEEGRVYEVTITPKDTTETCSEFLPFNLQRILASGKKAKPMKRPIVASAMVVK